MPKSKKNRDKHYNPRRWLRAPQTFSPASLAQVKDDYRRIELAVELKLHTGQLTRNDVAHIHQMITLVTFCLYAAYGIESDYVIETYGEEWVKLQTAVKAFEERAGTVLNAALDADPVRVLDIFMVSEDLDDMPAKAVDRVKWLNRKLAHFRDLRKKCGRLPQVGEIA